MKTVYKLIVVFLNSLIGYLLIIYYLFTFIRFLLPLYFIILVIYIIDRTQNLEKVVEILPSYRDKDIKDIKIENYIGFI